MLQPSARTRALLRTKAPRRGTTATTAIASAAEAWSGPALVYGSLSLLAIGTAFARGESPIETEAWAASLMHGRVLGHVVSLAGGIALAAATIKATRQFVKRWGWARALHADLRPSIRHAGGGTIVMLGVASAVSEELFFRGLLATVIGVIASSLAFGLLHQMSGRGRWIWATWATVMGLLFGTLFLATGSLVGPLVAHAAINVANLRYIRDTDVEAPKPRKLGGLLGRA